MHHFILPTLASDQEGGSICVYKYWREFALISCFRALCLVYTTNLETFLDAGLHFR